MKKRSMRDKTNASRSVKQKANNDELNMGLPEHKADLENNIDPSEQPTTHKDAYAAKCSKRLSRKDDIAEVVDQDTGRKSVKRKGKSVSNSKDRHKITRTLDKISTETEITAYDSETLPCSQAESPADCESFIPDVGDQEGMDDNMPVTDAEESSFGDPAAREVSNKDDIDRSGVIFCSRIPPFMSLSKLRSYFSRFGKVGKIYAESESMNDYKRRVKMGGNKKLKFLHGWIEFLDKTIAKQVANMLNGKPVGDKKRHNFWRDDLWNLLYLPKYKFNDVMAYLREHKNDRKEKLSFHLANSRKENYNYLEQLELEKKHKAIESRRLGKGLPAFKHKARIHKREEKHKSDEKSNTTIPTDLLDAIIT